MGPIAASGRPSRDPGSPENNHPRLAWNIHNLPDGLAIKRIGINLGGWPGRPELAPIMATMALGGWVMAGLPIWLLYRALGRPPAQG